MLVYQRVAIYVNVYKRVPIKHRRTDFRWTFIWKKMGKWWNMGIELTTMGIYLGYHQK
jgi:hypothetical protein